MPIYLPDDTKETTAQTAVAAIMPFTTTTVFTIAGGPIMLMHIISMSVTANNTNGATIQWTFDGTNGSATTITGASGSLASLAAGDIVIADMTLLTTVPAIISTGTSAMLGSPVTQRFVILNGPGILRMIIGTAATTGTWNHAIRYRPLVRGVSVTPAF